MFIDERERERGGRSGRERERERKIVDVGRGDLIGS